MRKHSLLFFACFSASVGLAYHVPQLPPKPLKEIQDPAVVRAHEDAAKAASKPDDRSVVDPAEIKQIQELAAKNSKREGTPAEYFRVVFKKDGTLGELEIVIPTGATRTPNEGNQTHTICSAKYNAKDKKLKLTDETKVDGPDDQELFSMEQLPIVCQELVTLSRLQKAFQANELKYTLEARVIEAPDEKSWAWEIGPSEEQMPNVIYGIYYYPITGELRTTPIERAGVAKKVEAAAKQAGLHITYVKSMNDR